jgi:hypothetical protein
VSAERDPELGEALGRALGSATAPYGAKLRVRRKLAERLAKPRAAALAVTVAAIVCAVALVFAFRPVTSPTAVPAPATRYSELTLRSARVLVRDATVLSVERDDATGTVLRLSSGAVLLHVQKGTGRSFEVDAGGTRVRVLGTVFGVAIGPRGAAVQVHEGIVEMQGRGGARTLRAGETWPPEHGCCGDSAAVERVRAPLPAGGTDALGMKSEEAAREPPATPPGGAPSRGPGDVAARRAATAETSRPSPLASATAKSAYSRARSLERAGDAAGALDAYKSIVDAGAENVEDALFATGRLRAERGDQRAVLAVAKTYRDQFPNGRYARDNDVLALNAALALGEHALALDEAERFLDLFPNDPRAWRFRLVRAAARARRGDCAGARSDVEPVPDGAAKRSVLERCGAEPP